MNTRDPKTLGSVPVFIVILSLLVSACLIGVTSTAFAGNNPSAKVAVHVRAHSAKAGCNYGTIETCADIVYEEPTFNFDAFPVFFNLTEYQGCEFGMTWPTWTYGATFTNCSDLVIGSIANPGDGSSHTWLSCQSGVCVPCFLWLYADAAGQVCMVPHPISGVIDVLDCAEGTDGAIATFCAGVLGGTGEDPCVEGPLCEVTPTTLGFGTVTVGSFADLSLFIENIGGGTLEGSVSEACDHYSITLGAGAYALAAGESKEVTVRFEPTSVGLKDCSVSTGTACADVVCSGTGEDPPVCEVTPESLDFGTVTTGQYAGRNFTIRNTGGGTLEGNVSEPCGDYSITSNEGAFSLGAGEQIVVGVRFTPTTPGLQECTVETGQAICADVFCSGVGEDPPSCEVVPLTLDFGTVTVGEFGEDTFTITNTGGGTLTGDPAEACPDYAIVGGGDPYALGNGEFVVVTVRFTPGSSGLKECAVDAGTDCAGVDCSGVGEDPPSCEVVPLTLDFGTVTVGDFFDLDFTIENVGGGLLDGTVSEACADFEITSGGGAYNLANGQQQVVTVRFTPSAAGPAGCTIATGTACGDVSCTGQGQEPTACDVSPTVLAFGTITVGEFADLGFTITNTGGGVLTGEVTEACADFEITSGGGPYELGGGGFVDVVVRFTPSAAGPAACTIATGTECADVSCTGTGEDAPVCEVTPTDLNFGTVTVGDFADRSFTITNTGGGTLTGEVAEQCPIFPVISGAGVYSLVGGEAVEVTVRFLPTSSGPIMCPVATGTECEEVWCVGTGEDAPLCDLSTTTLDFGTVTVGDFADRSFNIYNYGGGTLTGTVSEACADFEIISGGGEYSVQQGEWVDVTVRFMPTVAGAAGCTVETGTECENVSCTGTGQEGTACEVTPTLLSFGTVTTGEFADLGFTITNTGGGVLSSTVSEACADFEIISGGGAYNLGAGEFVDVTVRFAPGTPGPKACTVSTGADCADVSCNGTGELPPICNVAPSPLDFGAVTVGESADRTFTIFNIGGGVLTGTVSEVCSDFEIVSGGGAYNLGAGAFVDVVVRFIPTDVAVVTCTIETGTECANVSCNGEGQEPSACDVSPTVLGFGTVMVGDFADLSFTIANNGGGVLSGEVTEACADFDIISGGGPYDLAAGEYVDVVVRFAPSVMEPADCIIETGTECTNVSCTGTGDMPTACEVMPAALDFGDVLVGNYADLSFTITNTGGGILTGAIEDMCDDFDILYGGGPYDLPSLSYVDVVVRFAPTVPGAALCVVEPRGGCVDVICTGTGTEEPPVCAVDPTSLDFGTIPVGDFVDLAFTITNTGGGILSGMVTEMCDDFDILYGEGPYDLGSGEFVEVMVRFEPASPGLKECGIETGAACANVHCTGTGRGEGLMVYFDIKPGSCPNPLNVKSKGVLPAAILGTAAFDVMEIDLLTLRLMREGIGGAVMPLRWSYEDVGTPFIGEPCDCHERHGDGYTDLTLKFDTPDVVSELGLLGLPDGYVELVITGNLIDGEPIRGADCVRLKGDKERNAGRGGGNLGFGLSESATDGTESEIDISYYVETAGHIYLEIFDVRGRTIKTLVDETLGAGTYTAIWDRTGYSGEKVQSGVYFARLHRDSESETRKILLVN